MCEWKYQLCFGLAELSGIPFHWSSKDWSNKTSRDQELSPHKYFHYSIRYSCWKFAVDAPFQEVLKARIDGALCNLIWCVATLLTANELELDYLSLMSLPTQAIWWFSEHIHLRKKKSWCHLLKKQCQCSPEVPQSTARSVSPSPVTPNLISQADTQGEKNSRT